MKLKIFGIKAFLYDFDRYELHRLNDRLTWRSKQGLRLEHLLHKNADNKYWFYAGLLPLLKDEFDLQVENPPKPHGIELLPIPDDFLPGYKLFPFQKIAISDSITCKKGIVKIPTGGGKTLVMQGVLKHLRDTTNDNAIVVVPSITLADQFVERSLNHGFSSDEIGVYHGSKKDIKKITVFVVNSLHSKIESADQEIITFLRKTNVLMFDETHHLSAKTWASIAETCGKCDYILGYSGTPFENDDDLLQNYQDALIHGITGGKIIDIPHRLLQRIGLLAASHVHMLPIEGDKSKKQGHYARIYSEFVVKNKLRNHAIINACHALIEKKLTTLVLCQRKQHIEQLMTTLKRSDVVGVFGGNRAVFYENGRVKEKKIDYEDIKQKVVDKTFTCVFASQVFDEGVDIPGIQAMVMAGAGRSYTKIAQRTGRGLRAKKGDNSVYIIDFFDHSHVYLYHQSHSRLNFYKSIDANVHENQESFFQAIS